MSLLANLTPLESPVSYWNEPEAGEARPLRFAGVHCWRMALCAVLPMNERDSIFEWASSGGFRERERKRGGLSG